MKRCLKKFWATLLCVCLIGTMLSPTVDALSADQTTDPTLTKIKQKGELVVGLAAEYAPFEFHTTVNGKDKIVGADVELAEAIAKDLGVKLTIKDMGFDGLLGALQTGKVDMIISGMSKTPEREKVVDFSEPYQSSKQAFLVLDREHKKFGDTVASFDGKRLAVQKQTSQETFAQQKLPQSQITSLQSVPDAVTQLQAGKIDAIVVSSPIGEAYQHQNKLFKQIVPKDTDLEGDMSIAMPKNSPALQLRVNQVIDHAKSSGDYAKFHEHAADYMNDEKSFWQKYGSYFLKGTGYTLALAAIAIVFGVGLGTLLAMMKLSRFFLMRMISSVYVEYMRGTPLLVQAMVVFFGASVVLHWDLSAFAAGALAMGVNSAAYVTEIIRSGINSVDKGQLEAAKSLGFTYGKAMRHVVLPQAIRNILPALGNEFVTVIKEGSVISVLGVGELMFQTGVVRGASFEPFLPLLITSGIYFVLTFTLSRLPGFTEKRLAS